MNYLAHHGIKGQRWGVKHGPPYPLKESSKSAAEKNQKTNGSWVDVAEIAVPLAVLAIGKKLVTKYRDKTYDNAINSKFNELKSNRIDSKSGLPLKSKAYSESDDIHMVNPAYMKSGMSGKNNCMLCTATYELRKRGYDVMARELKPNSMGITNADLERWFPKAKVKSADGGWDESFLTDPKLSNIQKVMRVNKEIHKVDSDKLKDNLKKDLISQGNGARGNLIVGWKMIGLVGHSMFYEVKNGKLRIVDAQNGTIYDNPDDIFNLYGGLYRGEYMRMDNQTPDWDVIRNEVVRT